MLQHMYDRNLLPGGAAAERKLYTSFLASSFRTLRFGPARGAWEGHGAGKFNYLREKGAFTASPDGTFAV